jgi:radical SAM/Cys-rich protein
VDASPQGKKIMSRQVIDSIIEFLLLNKDLTLDITGGAPELNPNFDYFIKRARPLVKEIIVRSNLTVLFEPGKEYLPGFFRKYKIHLICSLPCYKEDNVDKQRGKGVFRKSLKALRLLNRLGFGAYNGLNIDLVYNPTGSHLPPEQDGLEKDYKTHLRKNYGIEFNRLITINNVPINRFKSYLDSRGEYQNYLKLLKDNYNPLAEEKIMCRELLSIGFDGRLYDCDFNQALGLALKGTNGGLLSIGKINIKSLEDREILFDQHCLSCVAGRGSSCQGELIKETGFSGQTKEAEMQVITNKIGTVKDYYGKILKTKQDLKTNVCCSAENLPVYLKKIVSMLDSEITDKFYGCGSPIPPLLKGCRVLDLGCGTGRDVYIASYLIGEDGYVIGIDMTDEQLDMTSKHIDSQMKRFGFLNSNVEFRKGYIEDLKEIGIEDNSMDVVISNCVINLSCDKRTVFSEIFRVLKPGGELYFSDVFGGCRIPQYLQLDPVLYAECLSGALYIEDFRRLLLDLGCPDYRIVSKKRLTISEPEIEAKIGTIDFYSMTIRAFKLEDLEDRCEDYGQVAIYQGTIPEYPHKFILDDHHIFIAGKPMLVCGNTASMLENTRFAKHFKLIGDRSRHYGIFSCSPASEKLGKEESSIGGACC